MAEGGITMPGTWEAKPPWRRGHAGHAETPWTITMTTWRYKRLHIFRVLLLSQQNFFFHISEVDGGLASFAILQKVSLSAAERQRILHKPTSAHSLSAVFGQLTYPSKSLELFPGSLLFSQNPLSDPLHLAHLHQAVVCSF